MTYEHKRIHYSNWMHLRKAKTSSKSNILAIVAVAVLLLMLQMVLEAIEEKEEVEELFLTSCKSRKALSACPHIHPSLQNVFTKSLVNKWLMHIFLRPLKLP